MPSRQVGRANPLKGAGLHTPRPMPAILVAQVRPAISRDGRRIFLLLIALRECRESVPGVAHPERWRTWPCAPSMGEAGGGLRARLWRAIDVGDRSSSVSGSWGSFSSYWRLLRPLCAVGCHSHRSHRSCVHHRAGVLFYWWSALCSAGPALWASRPTCPGVCGAGGPDRVPSAMERFADAVVMVKSPVFLPAGLLRLKVPDFPFWRCSVSIPVSIRTAYCRFVRVGQAPRTPKMLRPRCARRAPR